MESKTKTLSKLSRTFLIIASACLFISIYVPIWNIDLDAPQYPEGLNLKIHANKIGGNVDIINGLNHYIGMKTLHTEDFIEFTLLPYILGAFSILILLTAIFGNTRRLNLLLIALIAFGVVSMADFWRWEYDYGHDLNPEAAIIVPGMAYQPPLIGFKQLLNFGAYSMPDIGGWLIVASGLLILMAVVFEQIKARKALAAISQVPIASAIFLLLSFTSCTHKPQPIKLNSDNCHFCEMTLSDKRFGTELITDKGKIYKFDDLSCMLRYMKANPSKKYTEIYVSNYLPDNGLLEIEKVFLIQGETIGSPMGGNMAAFTNADSAKFYQEKLSAQSISWNDIKPN